MAAAIYARALATAGSLAVLAALAGAGHKWW